MQCTEVTLAFCYVSLKVDNWFSYKYAKPRDLLHKIVTFAKSAMLGGRLIIVN